MADIKFQDIWIEQCEAALSIKARIGVGDAFGYLVGEKLVNYVEASQDRPEFARELPRFVSEIRQIFTREEISENLREVESRFKAELLKAKSGHGSDEYFTKCAISDPNHLMNMKEMLLSSHLGTS